MLATTARRTFFTPLFSNLITTSSPQLNAPRSFSSEKKKEPKEALVQSSTIDNVTVLTLNNPKKYNGWTTPMMMALSENLKAAASNPNSKVTILTGADPYYCAGVDLSGTLKPMAPSKLKETIACTNQAVFDQFLDFPKPIIVAVNGPAIGAAVTTATLCDAIVASEKASFNTPFTRLGVPPEGCSSIHFEFLMGKVNAERMLGVEGWVPSGKEAVEVGLITKCVPHEELLNEAKKLAKEWVKEGKTGRKHMGFTDTTLMKATNKQESLDLAEVFLSEKFLAVQAAFLGSKGKTGPAMIFKSLVATRFIWSKFV